ncbi:MAG: GNAT family N-acetyltransferase [Oligoflexales bacterium]|nr:GNAT family N-acetyltransferase [Oligoflexales bacterium]
MSTSIENISIQHLSREDEAPVCELLHRNLDIFDERKCILVSTFRRLKNLYESYSQEGCHFLVAKDEIIHPSRTAACVGLGPLHGLPSSEGVGEIRDLVVDPDYRGHGLGRALLDRSIEAAKYLGYRRLYLEATQSMQIAHKLFKNRGFRPIKDLTLLVIETDEPESDQEHRGACYFLLENL